MQPFGVPTGQQRPAMRNRLLQHHQKKHVLRASGRKNATIISSPRAQFICMGATCERTACTACTILYYNQPHCTDPFTIENNSVVRTKCDHGQLESSSSSHLRLKYDERVEQQRAASEKSKLRNASWFFTPPQKRMIQQRGGGDVRAP